MLWCALLSQLRSAPLPRHSASCQPSRAPSRLSWFRPRHQSSASLQWLLRPHQLRHPWQAAPPLSAPCHAARAAKCTQRGASAGPAALSQARAAGAKDQVVLQAPRVAGRRWGPSCRGQRARRCMWRPTTSAASAQRCRWASWQAQAVAFPAANDLPKLHPTTPFAPASADAAKANYLS